MAGSLVWPLDKILALPIDYNFAEDEALSSLLKTLAAARGAWKKYRHDAAEHMAQIGIYRINKVFPHFRRSPSNRK